MENLTRGSIAFRSCTSRIIVGSQYNPTYVNLLKQRLNHDYDNIALKAIDDIEGRLSVVLEILSKLQAFHDMVSRLDTLMLNTGRVSFGTVILYYIIPVKEY